MKNSTSLRGQCLLREIPSTKKGKKRFVQVSVFEVDDNVFVEAEHMAPVTGLVKGGVVVLTSGTPEPLAKKYFSWSVQDILDDKLKTNSMRNRSFYEGLQRALTLVSKGDRSNADVPDLLKFCATHAKKMPYTDTMRQVTESVCKVLEKFKTEGKAK